MDNIIYFYKVLRYAIKKKNSKNEVSRGKRLLKDIIKMCNITSSKEKAILFWVIGNDKEMKEKEQKRNEKWRMDNSANWEEGVGKEVFSCFCQEQSHMRLPNGYPGFAWSVPCLVSEPPAKPLSDSKVTLGKHLDSENKALLICM